MDRTQNQRFRDAVERKRSDSDAAARATRSGRPVEQRGVGGDQDSLRSASQPQDTFSSREKNTRHKKVTADKWNQ
jgi:hypothetical protein